MNEKIFSTTVAGMEISLTRKTKHTFIVHNIGFKKKLLMIMKKLQKNLATASCTLCSAMAN